MVKQFKFAATCLISVILLVFFITVFQYNTERHSFNTVVLDKKIIYVDDKSTYLIITQHGVFQNTDSLLKGKFNSVYLNNKLKIGSSYNLTVVGFQIPLFDIHPNIIRVVKINRL